VNGETANAAIAGLGSIADAVAAFVNAGKKATLPQCSIASMAAKFMDWVWLLG